MILEKTCGRKFLFNTPLIQSLCQKRNKRLGLNNLLREHPKQPHHIRRIIITRLQIKQAGEAAAQAHPIRISEHNNRKRRLGPQILRHHHAQIRVLRGPPRAPNIRHQISALAAARLMLGRSIKPKPIRRHQHRRNRVNECGLTATRTAGDEESSTRHRDIHNAIERAPVH